MLYLRSSLTLVVALSFSSPASAADRFPEWRGANGQGHADATNLPVSWSETENVGWKVKVPGNGWSTPVIDAGRVWLTTAIDKPASEADAERRRKASSNSQPLTISESISLRAVGIDLKTGEILHDVELLNESTPQEIHAQNTYATPSPIIEDGRLYCHFGTYGMACLDTATGKVLWRNQTLRVKHENGPGSSPILWKDLLIVHCDGIDVQYIVALDKKTGKQAWKTVRTGGLRPDVQLRKSYATSLVVDVDGRPQVVSPAADWLYGYDPESGRELWKLNYGMLGFSNAARPIAGHGLIYASTGYMKAQLLAIRLDKSADSTQPTIAWKYSKQVPNVACPLLVGGEIYFASDGGVATCIDARTGDTHWTERIGKRFWASPLYADGRIHFFERDGETTVIEPGKTFRKLAVNKLGGTLYATAAAVDGALILRTSQALYCLKQ
ncbi:MAG: PQQ-binding-like beta-propeller repeat protein [Planctomycetota bacterium]|nr:PQQ-binding-like beta-propeller repeat protein [Planctomycetota bacterium]